MDCVVICDYVGCGVGLMVCGGDGDAEGGGDGLMDGGGKGDTDGDGDGLVDGGGDGDAEGGGNGSESDGGGLFGHGTDGGDDGGKGGGGGMGHPSADSKTGAPPNMKLRPVPTPPTSEYRTSNESVDSRVNITVRARCWSVRPYALAGLSLPIPTSVEHSWLDAPSCSACQPVRL